MVTDLMEAYSFWKFYRLFFFDFYRFSMTFSNVSANQEEKFVKFTAKIYCHQLITNYLLKITKGNL